MKRNNFTVSLEIWEVISQIKEQLNAWIFTKIHKILCIKPPHLNITTRLRLVPTARWVSTIFRTWRRNLPPNTSFLCVNQQTLSCCNYVAHSFQLWWNIWKLNSLRRWTISPGNITHFQQIEMVWSPPAIPCLFLSSDTS